MPTEATVEGGQASPSWGAQAVGDQPAEPSQPGLTHNPLIERLKRTEPHEEPIEDIQIADREEMTEHWWRFLWRGFGKFSGFATRSAAMDIAKGFIGFGLSLFGGVSKPSEEPGGGRIRDDEVIG